MTNAYSQFRTLSAFMMALTLLILTGCDVLNSNDPEVATLSDEEIEEASEILSQSLADQSEGLMANLYDMTGSVNASGILHERRAFSRNPALRPCRGVSREYEYEYDEESGQHTIEYEREHEGRGCTKSIAANLVYVFADADGNYIEFPRVNKSAISTIDFNGDRMGSATNTPNDSSEFSSTFSRVGTWSMTGLNSESGIATLNGTQTNTGEYTKVKGDSSKSGVYEVTFQASDVTIDGSAEERDLENEISGTITYSMTMTKTRNGVSETKEAEGTIELENNGRALLRFLGLKKVYRVSLDDGRVDDVSEQEGDD